MERLEVLIAKKEGAGLPCYATDASSGVDLCAFLEESMVIKPLERSLVPTGIFIGIPKGYEAEVRPRSGIAIKHGVTVLNTPGTIDADYRGEIGLIVINHGEDPFVIKRGMRMAQMVVQKVLHVEWIETSELKNTKRGDGGFGHTSKSTS